ncbi:uncharacterized protein C2845_PM06G29040 [Panicum miliaceum]|uniref:Uncharacterized protein n=1 Tax=Panicum miliaceum TaxID=4540 RepID=A0A3L6R6G3_PANMI|nr:uncharacterized protein C2845_PM06G29040 [Panicum miliaceum]
MNQYRQLQEVELRCQLLQQQIQDKRRLLELCHPEDEDPIQTGSPPRRQPQQRFRSEVVRPRERTICIEDDLDESSEDEYYRDRREYHRRSRKREEAWTPLAVELEWVLWPPRFNAVILRQYDEEIDLREFLLKDEAAVESNGGGLAVKAKAFIMGPKRQRQSLYLQSQEANTNMIFKAHQIEGVEAEEEAEGVEEAEGLQGQGCDFAIFTAGTRATGQMSAPSLRKKRRSWTGNRWSHRSM